MIRDEESLNLLLSSVEGVVRERLAPNEAIVSETDRIPQDVIAVPTSGHSIQRARGT